MVFLATQVYLCVSLNPPEDAQSAIDAWVLPEDDAGEAFAETTENRLAWNSSEVKRGSSGTEPCESPNRHG